MCIQNLFRYIISVGLQTVKEDIVKAANNETLPQCDPCRLNNKNEHAKYYCKDCVEYYCDQCFTSHKTLKSFKNHVALTIEDMLPSTHQCKLCYAKNHSVNAGNWCEDCDEYICGSCTIKHWSTQQNIGHHIKPLQKTISCEPCTVMDTYRPATAYCVDCKELEPLCDDCAQQHKAMKTTKHHTISKDKFTLYLKFKLKHTELTNTVKYKAGYSKEEKPVYGVPKTVPEKILYCAICSELGVQSKAVLYCLDCEISELLCSSCSEDHRSMKRTKHHQLSNENPLLIDRLARQFKEMENKLIDLVDKNDKLVTEANERQLKESSKIKENEKKFKELQGENAILKANIKTKEDEIEKLSKRDHYVANKENTESQYQERQEAKLELRPDVQSHLVKEKIEKPSKPYVTEDVNKSDHIILKWEHNGDLSVDEFYQIFMKQYQDGKWKIFQTPKPCITCLVTVDGLKAETSYVFKVRKANDTTGEDGPFSPESDIIVTGESPAFKIIRRSAKIEHGIPAVYRLPIQEISQARNEASQTRKFILGTPGHNPKEKTVMIVGATGSGKTTLINGMANYAMGITWEDPFRFTLTHLETCEKERVGNEALSQTEWITCYTICSDVASRIDYTINFIDTPGFGDTRGLEQDVKIVSQIRDLFTAKDARGIATLDAVCFVLKAPDARLTTTQKYIFESFLALFGKDIKNNICTLVTFADGQRPPVLAALEALEGTPLPFTSYFPFNNSALFVDNRADHLGSLSPFFWEMGIKSCGDFFQSLDGLPTRSLLLTAEVLAKRQKLENTILHLQEEINLGLSKINLLQLEVNIFTKYKKQIQDNENFEYEVDESKMKKVDISGTGIHTTTCLTCNFTCHNNCAFANDSEKANCCAMGSGGHCTECPKNCHWSQHSNVPYVFQWYTQKVKKTYSEMKDKYQQANRKKMSQEEVLEEMHEEIKVLEIGIQMKVEEITKYGNRLKEIAPRPYHLSTVQYIELMIESEMREKKSGFNQRIETLEQCKKRAEIGKTFFEHRLRGTRATLNASTAADDSMSSDKDQKCVFKKCKQLLFG